MLPRSRCNTQFVAVKRIMLYRVERERLLGRRAYVLEKYR